MVFKSPIRSLGPNPRAAVATEGSTKYRVSDVRIADLDLRLGFQANESSITNIFFKASIYEDIVLSSEAFCSLVRISSAIVEMEACAP